MALSAGACVPAPVALVKMPVSGAGTVLVLQAEDSAPAPGEIAPSRPDLVIEDIRWLPASPRLGDEVVFKVTVVNRGADDAGASSLTCYLDDDYLETVAVGPLEPGAAASVELSWISKAGSHVITAEADSGRVIPEEDEANNSGSFAFSVLAPDLVITAIDASPQEPDAGDKVTFTVTVKNEGSSSSRFSRVDFYIDGASQGYRDVPVLAAGEELTRSFSWIAREGMHHVAAVADPLDRVRESDETNNTGGLDYATTSPDLIISQISWSPASPVAGDNITISMAVKNQGPGKSSSSWVSYYIDDGYIASAYIKPLAPGSSASVSFSWETQTGSHSVKARADAAESVAELDEENNMSAVSLPSPSADLVVQNITWSPSTPLVAHRLTFNITVANRGLSIAPVSRLYFYIGKYPHYFHISELAPGATANVTLGWVTLPGTWSVEAIADAEKVIMESNESNNTRTSRFTAATSAPSDLLVGNLGWSPDSPVPGDDVTFSVTVRNQGSGKSAWSNVACYIDDNLLASELLSPLSPGASATLELTWQATPGTHTLRVIADSEQRLAEDSEDNNTKTATVRVPAPDFLIKDVDWTPLEPAAGETVTFTITVANQGDYPAAPSYLGYFVDGSPRGRHYIDGLAAGATAARTFTWTAQQGDHKIEFSADMEDKVPELAENNNVKSVSIPTPDLSLEGIAWSPESSDNATGNQTVLFNVMIHNIGSGKADPSSIYFYLDDSYLGEVTVPQIVPGGTATGLFAGAIPAGSHEIRVTADGENSLTELDETNNARTLTFPFSAAEAAPPGTAAEAVPTPAVAEPEQPAAPPLAVVPDAPAEEEPLPIDLVISKTTPGVPPQVLALINGILERWWPALATVLLGAVVILFLLRIRSRQKLQNET